MPFALSVGYAATSPVGRGYGTVALSAPLREVSKQKHHGAVFLCRDTPPSRKNEARLCRVRILTMRMGRQEIKGGAGVCKKMQGFRIFAPHCRMLLPPQARRRLAAADTADGAIPSHNALTFGGKVL